LYSEESFNRSLLKVTVPEILRSNLASVSLQMKAMWIEAGMKSMIGLSFIQIVFRFLENPEVMWGRHPVLFSAMTHPSSYINPIFSDRFLMAQSPAQDVVNFDFMEPPDRVRLVKSLRLLFLIGALDVDGKLTALGEARLGEQ
jgi:HrpA-like RNA helicase